MDRKKIKQISGTAIAIVTALFAPRVCAQEGAVFENKGGLNYATADGDFTFGMLGRIQADAALYDEDAAALGSGTEFRRARIGAQGTFYQDWGFKAELDFADEVWRWRMSIFNTSASIRWS